jgi:sulfatase maturation enzyme AslB (radical SAM superfamily)
MHLNVTATSSCKANCVYCPQDQFRSAMHGRPLHLSRQEFSELLPSLAGTHFRVVSFGGFTEPFDNPEIVDLLTITSKQTFVDEVHIYSTGEGFTPRIVEKLQPVRLAYVEISCHGFDTETYRRTRPFVDVAKVRDNMLFLFQNRNNIDRLTVSVTGPFGSPAALAELEALCIKSGASFERRDLHSRAGLLRIGHEREVLKSGPFRCAKFDFGKPVLVPGGDLALCCQDFAMEYVIGNLHKQPFEEIMRDSPVRTRVLNAAAGLSEDPQLKCYRCIFCVPTDQNVTPAESAGAD